MSKKKGIPRTHVDIAFFEHPTFSSTCTALENVRKLLECSGGSVDPLALVDVMGATSIRCENYAATPKKQASHSSALPVPKALDPKNVFRKHVLEGRDLVYTEDNEVLFYVAKNMNG